MTVRRAQRADLPRMVELAAVKRAEYAEHLPFWRPATGAVEAQTGFFQTLLESDTTVALVFEVDGRVEGFIFGNVTEAPPVYDPGGKGCLVDDFVVSDPVLWKTAGLELLRAAERQARDLGATFAIVVSGHHDTAKRDALASAGAYIGTEFHVHAIE